jgi:hypothetical protein
MNNEKKMCLTYNRTTMQSVGGKPDTELQKFTFVLKRYESADTLCTASVIFR